MKAVGVKLLKTKLSQYLRMVRAGETILVTDRDQVVAELRPPNRQSGGPSGLDEGLKRLAERGEAVLASRPARSWKGFRTKRRLARSSARVLDELRRDAR